MYLTTNASFPLNTLQKQKVWESGKERIKCIPRYTSFSSSEARDSCEMWMSHIFVAVPRKTKLTTRLTKKTEKSTRAAKNKQHRKADPMSRLSMHQMDANIIKMFHHRNTKILSHTISNKIQQHIHFFLSFSLSQNVYMYMYIQPPKRDHVLPLLICFYFT